jgi:hypothetical protein
MQTELPSGSDPEYNQFTAVQPFPDQAPVQSNIEQYPLQFLINRIMENFSLNYKTADLIEVVRSLKTVDPSVHGILPPEILKTNQPVILRELARKANQHPIGNQMEKGHIVKLSPSKLFSPHQESDDSAILAATDEGEGSKTPNNELIRLKSELVVVHPHFEAMEHEKEGSLNENGGDYTDSDESEEETGSKNLLDKVIRWPFSNTEPC